jgi:hypothetical protein
MIEEQAFMRQKSNGTGLVPDPDSFVDIGGSLNGKAKLKTGVAEGETQMRAELFAHYDAKQIKKSLADAQAKGHAIGSAKLGDSGSGQADAEARRKYIRPATQGAFSWESKLKFEIAKQAVEFFGKLEVKKGEWGVDVGAGIKFDTAGTPTDFEKVATGIVSASTGLAKTLGGFYQNHKKRGGDQAFNAVGNIGDIGGNVTNIANAGLDNSLGKALAQAYQVNNAQSEQVNETATNFLGDTLGTSKDAPANQATRAGASSEMALQVLIHFGSSGFHLDIKDVSVRKASIGLGSAALDIELEKQKRLARIGMVDGKFSVEALGFTNRADKTT